MPQDAVEFAAIMFKTPAPEYPAMMSVTRAETVVAAVKNRLQEAASASRIKVIARAVAAAT